MTKASTPDTSREHLLTQAQAEREWDLAVIGGGATGLGVALDAAARGFSVVLVESTTSRRAPRRAPPSWCTAACATWRRATSAWCARRCTSAPRCWPTRRTWRSALPFVMPGYHWWERGFYGVGLKMYDALAGRAGPGRHRVAVTRRDAASCCPTVRRAA